MTIQITVIGLGQIGASFGLALSEHQDKVYCCGHDPELTRAKKMEKEGAFQKTFFNLPDSVRQADVVILALPIDQVEDTLKYIAEDLRSGVVVIDTSPLRAGISDWAKKYLPADRHFVSMMPVINPAYLDEKFEDALVPHADLFANSQMVIATDYSTHPDAVKLASDLANLVGAKTYFADPLEADGICAKIDLLPKLVSAALLMSTIKQSGWQDTRRFASSAYSKTTESASVDDNLTHPGLPAILNRDNSLQAIDTMIASLREIRDLIESKDEDHLDILLKEVHEGRTKWVEDRKSADWDMHIDTKPPSVKETMGGLFGIRPKSLKKK